MARVLALAVATVVAGASACGDRAPTPRDRVLATLPAPASLVVVADGPALLALEPAIAELRTAAPPSVGCVIDAALASTQTGFALGDRGATFAIATEVAPTSCPLLSQLASGVWVATIGGGEVASASQSALDDPGFARARDYLRAAPVALAADLPTAWTSLATKAHVIATASASPLEAWASVDFASPAEADAFAALVRATVDATARQLDPALAAHLTQTRSPTQVVVRLARMEAPAQLVAGLARAIAVPLVALRGRTRTPSPKLACPSSGAVRSCAASSSGLKLAIGDFPAIARELADAELAPVVNAGMIEGVRVGSAGVPSLGLVPGDVVLSRDGRPLTRGRELVDALAHPAAMTLLMSRGPVDQSIDLAPP